MTDTRPEGSNVPAAERSAAERLVEKVRLFASNELDDDERALFGALIVPGLSQAMLDDDVQGFATTHWTPQRLPDALVTALRNSRLRVDFREE